ncbi:unnamed protein product, partial [Phaeothamnion confervicola]
GVGGVCRFLFADRGAVAARGDRPACYAGGSRRPCAHQHSLRARARAADAAFFFYGRADLASTARAPCSNSCISGFGGCTGVGSGGGAGGEDAGKRDSGACGAVVVAGGGGGRRRGSGARAVRGAGGCAWLPRGRCAGPLAAADARCCRRHARWCRRLRRRRLRRLLGSR